MSTEAKNESSGVVATAVAVGTLDIESQQQKPVDADVGKGMGIAMVVLLVVGFIFNFVFPVISFICIIATIVIASILSCGCCCASDYDLQPDRKRFATATLVSLCLMFVVQIVGFVAIAASAINEASETGTFSQSSFEDATTGVIIIGVVGLVLNVMAVVFSALFTWGRGCCTS